MTTAESQWRIELAERIAPLYRSLPDVGAAVLIGGIARGRGDRYSDLDISVFWHRTPTEDERRAVVSQFAQVLNTEVVIGDFSAVPVFDHSDDGLLFEEAVYLGGDASIGFKIDINHRTVASMHKIIDDVLHHYDTRNHKLEVMYSIQHVHVLHGEDLIRSWQAQAAQYPDALSFKLVEMHLSQLKFDAAVHVHRGDLLPFYRLLVDAQANLIGALLALNRIYHPELKRLQFLCDEMHLKPDNLYSRLNACFTQLPQDALALFDELVNESLHLIEQHMPSVDVNAFHQRYYARRQPYVDSPLLGSK